MNTLEIERRLNERALHQLGLVTHNQASAAGINSHALHERIGAGTLIRVHEGVYRVRGVEPSRQQELLAACLAVPGSAICDFSAAFLHGLPIGQRHASHRPSVLVGHGTGRKSTAALIVRRTRQDIDTQTWHGGRVTTVASTIIALAGLVPPIRLARCIDHAVAHRLTTVERLTVNVEQRSTSRFHGRPALLRELRARTNGTVLFRSGTEQTVAHWIALSKRPMNIWSIGSHSPSSSTVWEP